MKYVINKCFGGFGLSSKALKVLHEDWGCPGVAIPIEEYAFTPEEVQDELKNEYSLYTFSDDLSCVLSDNMFSPYYNSTNRANPYLVNVVTDLGKEANGPFASLVIVDVPDGVEVEITEYDGMESIREASRYFG